MAGNSTSSIRTGNSRPRGSIGQRMQRWQRAGARSRNDRVVETARNGRSNRPKWRPL